MSKTSTTTLTDITDVMGVLTSDHKSMTDSYRLFENKFKDIFNYKPNQNVTAYDVVIILNRYLNGNGSRDVTN